MSNRLTPRGEAARKPAPAASAPVEELPAEGTCLICLATARLVKGRPGQSEVVAPHTHSHDPKIYVTCRGAGHVPAQHDGRDEQRVQAVLKFADVQREIGEARAAFLQDMDKFRSMYDVIDLDAQKIIILESTAKVWEFMASSGDWWNTLAYALGELDIPNDATLSPLKAMERRGFKRWIVENRMMLSRMLLGGGEHDADADSVARAPEILADIVLNLL